MVTNPVFAELPLPRVVGLYVLLVAVATAGGWLFVFKLGQALLTLFTRRFARKESLARHELSALLSILAGLWAFTLLTSLAGLLGLYGLPALTSLAAAILLGCRRLKIPIPPKWDTPGRWRREEPFAFWASVTTIGLIALAGVADFAAWFDGNFVIAGAHLARTGKLLVEHTDGQFGMVTLTALLKVVFSEMSPITVIVGWGPAFPPLILLGMHQLLRELFGKKRWEPLALLIFAFPVAMKAHEIRGSVSGFLLGTWTLVLVLRHLRNGRFLDLAGAALALASAWNFGQLAAAYLFLFLGFWSVGAYAAGRADRAAALWRVLLWANVAEYAILPLSFAWNLPEGASWRAFLPGTGSLLLAAGVLRVLPLLPKLRVPKTVAAAVYLATLALAYFANPHSAPTYNWYFYMGPVSFDWLNFWGYGAFGALFLAALALALKDFVASGSPPTTLLWNGFFVSCLVQALAPRALTSGTTLVAERAFLWDGWKDTTLFWINPLMVVGVAYLLERLSRVKAPARLRRVFSPAGAPVLATLLLIPCVQRLEPYAVLAGSGAKTAYERLNAFFTAHLIPNADHPWRAQQSYTLPMYAAYALFPKWRLGGHFQAKDCALCTVQSYGFLQREWPVIELLLRTGIAPGDSFISGDSIGTPEVYLNRQIRYRDGANTICPIYQWFHDGATAYEFYWKPKGRIRRNRSGMAYSILDPDRNLTWLNFRTVASGALEAEFSVFTTREYELYVGEETSTYPTEAKIDGVPMEAWPAPAAGRLRIEGGRKHVISISPRPGAPPVKPGVRAVLYPLRYWEYERLILEGAEAGFGGTAIARLTGVPSAPVTIEEMTTVMSSSDPSERAKILEKHRIRFIIFDPIARTAFPHGLGSLRADPSLRELDISGTPVFLARGPLSGT